MRKIQLTIVFALVALLVIVGAVAAQPTNYRTHLTGDEENPPVNTQAQGQAIFQLAGDEASLDYKLIVANIDNVFAAHIHCGAVGVNGPVGVTLFFVPPPNLGRVDGILAEDTITEPDLGNACGWETLADVVAAIESGDTYVNVHTNPGTPSGEIRGQIH
jgi:hypothetical protein